MIFGTPDLSRTNKGYGDLGWRAVSLPVKNMMSEERHVVLFGTFDGVHDGHRDLFRQARGFGGRLTVIIARDLMVLRLKHQVPSLAERIRHDIVMGEELVDAAALGDSELSVYHELRKLNPDVICLGYDQQELGADLQIWMDQSGESFPIYYLQPYKPNTLHNSIMRPNRR